MAALACSSEVSHCAQTPQEIRFFCSSLFCSLHCIYFSLLHFNLSISVRAVLFSNQPPPGDRKGSWNGGRDGKHLAKVCSFFYTAVKTRGWEKCDGQTERN